MKALIKEAELTNLFSEDSWEYALCLDQYQDLLRVPYLKRKEVNAYEMTPLDQNLTVVN